MDHQTTRRGALKCLGLGAGTLFSLAGGVLIPHSLAEAAEPGAKAKAFQGAAARRLVVHLAASEIVRG